MNKNEQILKLRSEGKSYNEIVQIVGCSKGTVSYYCGDGQKNKTLDRQRKNRSNAHPYISKIDTFMQRKKKNKQHTIKSSDKIRLYTKIKTFQLENGETKLSFSAQDVIDKFGENPKCYLTGEEIDVSKPASYHFDHIIPVSKGGDNSIDNLGICTRRANQSKFDMTPDEYIQHCKNVLKHFGYTINK